MIIHQRRQYSVGQGCFHAGFVGASQQADDYFALPGVRYVYDCGSMGKYQRARRAEVKRFHNDSSKLPIDFLFISHLHEDHISGIETLCGLHRSPVDTIVLPLLNALDRLICFARAVAEDPGYADEFHQALTVDPVTALARLNPRQIILVRRGSEGGAPPPGEPEEPTGDVPRDGGDPASKREGIAWRLIGSGRSERKHTLPGNPIGDSSATPNPIDVFEIDDTCAIALDEPSAKLAWILAPYVDPAVGAARDTFLQTAADLFGITTEEFTKKAEDANWLRRLVTAYKATLSKAYTAIADPNVTSLCLFSGPFNGAGPCNWEASFGRIRRYCYAIGSHRVGWMGTGDADLKKPARRHAFLNHYGPHVPQVSTLLLPHHGSEHNFDSDLLDGIGPYFTLAAADAYSNWRHPGSGVIQAVSSRGFPLWVVTSSTNSRLNECVRMEYAPMTSNVPVLTN